MYVSTDLNNPISGINRYGYDYNGNLIRDDYKALAITNNDQNLPDLLDFGSNNRINYFYNSIGEKMLRAVSVGGATPTLTYYFGPFVHEGLQGGTSSLKRRCCEQQQGVRRSQIHYYT